jgi:hypothetical protein
VDPMAIAPRAVRKSRKDPMITTASGHGQGPSPRFGRSFCCYSARKIAQTSGGLALRRCDQPAGEQEEKGFDRSLDGATLARDGRVHSSSDSAASVSVRLVRWTSIAFQTSS